MYSVERSSIEMTKRELATAISKYEAASNEVQIRIIETQKVMSFVLQ